MDKLISLNQSAFIRDRLTQHNVVVIHEVLHALKHGKGVNQFTYQARHE